MLMCEKKGNAIKTNQLQCNVTEIERIADPKFKSSTLLMKNLLNYVS